MTKVFLSTLIFALIVSSCALNRTYNFTLINTTGYKIDSLEIGCGKQSATATILPFDTTKNVTVPFKYIFPFTEPLMCMTVKNYSSSRGKFTNPYGIVIAESKLKRWDNNLILIELKVASDKKTDIFKLHLIRYGI